eukprot:759698-Hanusia_phi.AAC.1
MGKSNAGKTSMRSIIFANYIARETTRLGYTQDVEHSHVRFLGNLVLNLWDCGGQEAYMESYFESQVIVSDFSSSYALNFGGQSGTIFFEMLRYDTCLPKYFTLCIDALRTNSENPKVFCLVHKMDLVPEESRDQVPTQCERLPYGMRLCIGRGRRYLIPNVAALEKHLASFCEASGCGADEVVLFERATFLVISHSTRKAFRDISNIIKQFKLSCSKSQAQFNRMQVICSDPAALPAMTLVNINNARSYFEKHISMDIGGESAGKAV